jgi:hypothetical protein
VGLVRVLGVGMGVSVPEIGGGRRAEARGRREGAPSKGYKCFHCNSAKHRIGECPVKKAGKPPCNGAKHTRPKDE